MKLKNLIGIAFVALSATVQAQSFFGAEREISADRYGQAGALRIGQAVECVVVSVRDVTIKPNASALNQSAGATVGGALGGLLGNAVSRGDNRPGGTLLGGLLGGVAGVVIAQPGEVAAQEVVIRRVGGTSLIVVTQAGRQLTAGDLVLAAEINGEVRISKFQK